MRRRKRTSFDVYCSRSSIDNSERNSLSWCVFAMGIRDSIQGAQGVRVDKVETRFSYQGFRYVFKTPEKSARIAQSYDEGRLLKREITPWHDTLSDAVSIEPVQRRRPTKKIAVATKAKSSTVSTTRRINRWNGRKI